MRHNKSMCFFISAAAIMSGCTSEEIPITKPESRPAKLFTVSVGESVKKRIFPANSEAGDNVILSYRVAGKIDDLRVRAGQQVTVGASLASLDKTEYELLERQAKANYELAKVQFERIESQYKQRFVSEQSYDEAKANLITARSQWNQSKLNLGYTNLIAPYSGTISLVNVEQHEYVVPSNDVMHIQSNQLLKIIFQVPTYLIKELREQKPEAYVRFDAFDKLTFPITYQEISTESDRVTGSYTVTSLMERPKETPILPGMTGKVEMTLQNEGRHAIPKKALWHEGNDIYVWRVDAKGIVQKTQVTLSQSREVLSGLKDGERIVLSGISALSDGMKVRPWVQERGL
ncbi:efflux RND transporter periplasmic adaptor subunit [Vibrio sp.]|nr:efflux RND transporter periplasmic adaptor subunit [Vibrio sp.]